MPRQPAPLHEAGGLRLLQDGTGMWQQMNPKCHAIGEGGLSMPMWKGCLFQLPMMLVVPENQETQTQETKACKPTPNLVLSCHHGDHL
jgi:spore coat polysaccharide biosynthesis predicted glycosyltransferase SpsG